MLKVRAASLWTRASLLQLRSGDELVVHWSVRSNDTGVKSRRSKDAIRTDEKCREDESETERKSLATLKSRPSSCTQPLSSMRKQSSSIMRCIRDDTRRLLRFRRGILWPRRAILRRLDTILLETPRILAWPAARARVSRRRTRRWIFHPCPR